MFEFQRLKAFADAPMPEVVETSTKSLIRKIIQGWMAALDETDACDEEAPDLTGVAAQLLELVQSFRSEAELDCEGHEIEELFGSIRRGLQLHIAACELLITGMDEGDIDARERILALVSQGDSELARARADVKRYQPEQTQ